MPRQLKRFHNTGNYHLITFSCDGRRPYLQDSAGYSLFETKLERFRARYGLTLYGYVLMPEHVHLLVNEPQQSTLANVVGVLKQQTSHKLIGQRDAFWETRYHDVNLFNAENAGKALKYIHRNPVARGLVEKPEDWPWSSFRHYLTGLPGTVQVESWWMDMARKHHSVLPER